MSRIPMGKVLFRNVVRHTNAHNKIQEESEMWKMRQWEKDVPNDKLKPPPSAEFTRGRMHCDRVSNDSRERSRSHERTSGQNEKEARYWTRRLYDFEAGDPDRWGHSGFKELYPEEFNDGEKERGNGRNGHHKRKRSKSGSEAAVSKHSKKSSRKKKKKRKKKEDKRRAADGSSSDSSSDESDCKRKRKRTKSKHKSKKSERNRGRDKEDSDSEDSDGGEREKRTSSRKKRKSDLHRDAGLDSRKKRRKDWKAANDNKSDDTSD